jgi:hypothetical protein
VPPCWLLPQRLTLVTLVLLALLMAPAHAGQGWYVLTPPLDSAQQDWKVRLWAPLSQWSQDGAFDSAHDCERERKTRKAMADEQILASPPQETMDVRTKLLLRSNAARLLSLCIASDDPRLKP